MLEYHLLKFRIELAHFKKNIRIKYTLAALISIITWNNTFFTLTFVIKTIFKLSVLSAVVRISISIKVSFFIHWTKRVIQFMNRLSLLMRIDNSVEKRTIDMAGHYRNPITPAIL